MKIECYNRYCCTANKRQGGGQGRTNMGAACRILCRNHGGYVIRQTSKILLIKTLVVSICITSNNVHTKGKQEEPKPVLSGTTKKPDAQLLKRAISYIRRTIKRANNTGTPYLVSCQYKIENDKPVSATAEVHYSDYRKKSDEYSVEFAPTSGKLDRLVKFVYRPKTNVLAVVNLDAQNRHLETRKVSLAL